MELAGVGITDLGTTNNRHRTSNGGNEGQLSAQIYAPFIIGHFLI